MQIRLNYESYGDDLRDQSIPIQLDCIIIPVLRIVLGVDLALTSAVLLAVDRTDWRLVLLSVRAVLTNGSFLGYCQYGSVLPNLAAVCAPIYHAINTLTLTPTLILTPF